MRVFHSSTELKEHLSAAQKNGTSIGLVPTMGALHSGHISLVEASVAENGLTVVSIFVNPKQFNEAKDLELYPRNLEEDVRLLSDFEDLVIFAPSAQDVYRDQDEVEVDLGGLGSIMEARSRPGHFNGVVQVLHRLFGIICPDRAYFGEKDRQQLMVIQIMVNELELNVKIISCPTIRNSEGLALSSRNELLTEEQQQNALILYRSLQFVQIKKEELAPADIVRSVKTDVGAAPSSELEYLELIDLDTLEPVNNWKKGQNVAAFIAARIGGVRLIDNVVLKA